MNTSRQWLYFSLIRVGIFGVALAVLLLLNVNPFLATLVAAVVGLCLSYLFLHKRRDDLSRNLQEIRTAKRQPVQYDRDNDIENMALDELNHENGTSEGQRE